MRVVDQREVQSRRGVCGKYPVACVVYDMLSKHGLYKRILDVTFGRGRFYAKKLPEFLVGVDPVRRDWIVYPHIFFQKTVQQVYESGVLDGLSFDVVVVDPPFNARRVRWRLRREFEVSMGLPEEIIRYAFALAKLLGVGHLFLHFHYVVPGDIVDVIGFRPISRNFYSNAGLLTFFVLYKV